VVIVAARAPPAAEKGAAITPDAAPIATPVIH